jgi:hypothetical protein
VAAEDPMLVRLFEKWNDRALQELRLEGSPAPSRSMMATFDYDYYIARGSFGGLVSERSGRSRPAKIEVVVGDDTLNSTRFQAQSRFRFGGDAWQRLNLVVEDVPIAIERDLWMATDSSYKTAVATLQAKSAGRASVAGESPPDWSDAPSHRSIQVEPRTPLDHATLRSIAIDASAKLRDLEKLDRASVRVNTVEGLYTMVDSGGIVLVQRVGYAVVRAYAAIRRPDGVDVHDERQWVARTAADLPSKAELEAAVEALGRSVLARAAADPVDYYEGPVLFEGEAAADFFRYLLPPELRGTPPLAKSGESYDKQTRSGPRLGRKLLPDGWSVVDDPRSAQAGEAGGFDYDFEGVASQSVSLVDDGWVRGFVMSRVPRKGLEVSNGHARGAIQSNWEGRLSLWTVRPKKSLSQKRLEREVDKVRRASGQDHILVVRRMGRSKEGTLPRPTDAVWRAADGSETPALSVMFQNVDRRTLRDIGAAGGGEQRRAYLASLTAGHRAGTDGGLPMVIRSPRALIVQNLEVVFPGPDEKPYALSRPQPQRSQRSQEGGGS